MNDFTDLEKDYDNSIIDAETKGKQCDFDIKGNQLSLMKEYILNHLADNIEYIGDLRKKNSEYLFSVSFLQDTNIEFDNKIYQVHSLDTYYPDGTGTLKISAQFLEDAILF
jgi:hypothetical protein